MSMSQMNVSQITHLESNESIGKTLSTIEMWLNKTLEQYTESLAKSMMAMPQDEEQTASTTLSKIGLDRDSLSRTGLSRRQIDRLYRGLFVYSTGFHHLIGELAQHVHFAPNIVVNAWRAYLHLLEVSHSDPNANTKDVSTGQYTLALALMDQLHRENNCKIQEECTNRIAEMEDTVLSVQEHIANTKQRLIQTEITLEEEKMSKERLQDELQEVSRNKSTLRDQKAALEHLLSQRDAKIEEIGSDLKDAYETLEEFENQQKQLKQANLSLQMELNSSRDSNTKLLASENDHRHLLAQAQIKIDQLSKDLSKSKAETSEKIGDIIHLNSIVDDLKNQMSLLKENFAQIVKEKCSVELELEESRNNEKRSIRSEQLMKEALEEGQLQVKEVKNEECNWKIQVDLKERKNLLPPKKLREIYFHYPFTVFFFFSFLLNPYLPPLKTNSID